MSDTSTKNPSLPCPAEKLILHRPPLLLIESLTEREGDSATATATLGSDSIFYTADRGALPEYFIEIMAQTMAAAQGFDALLQNQQSKDHYIVGIETYSLHCNPDDPLEFQICIKLNLDLGPVKIMEGRVISGSTTIATAELKVWESEKHKS